MRSSLPFALCAAAWPREKTDYDSPWKEILEPFFEPCLRFFFPSLHAQIDWSQAAIFRDKELQQISYDAETGRQTVDKLAQVRLRSGVELWLLIHVEVQGQWEAAFATRMYVYNYRLFDRFKQHAVSLAILTDANRHWRPDHYEHEVFGCRVRLDFPVAKILEYEPQITELEQDVTPFALVVLAHLRTLQTVGKEKAQARKDFKKQLLHLCWQRGYEKKWTGQLLRFLDWVMKLPKNLEQQLRQELAKEEKLIMKKYVTSWERMAGEESELKTLRTIIADTLELRFGKVPRKLNLSVKQIVDPQQLRALHRQAVTCTSLESFTEQLSVAE